MNAIRGFLANYSGNFQIALMLWPVISAMLTLPILAYLYHRDGRLRMGSVLTTYLAVLYLLGIGCFTLWPLPTGDEGLGITYGVAANFDRSHSWETSQRMAGRLSSNYCSTWCCSCRSDLSRGAFCTCSSLQH